MKFFDKFFTSPPPTHTPNFTLILALSVLIGCQVESNEAEKTSYTVTYNANGGSGEMKAQTAEEGTEITLTANAFTREGYTFSGWNTVADGKGTDHADKSTFKLTENITLYAKWTVASADKIVVLKDGVVAEQGSPAELLEKGGIYSKMISTQLKASEWKYE